MTGLSKNILNTITYYDILDYPLTSFEIWKYLTAAGGNADEKGECSLGEVIEGLENGDIKRHIEEFRGFYFLRGRKELVKKRIQNDKNSIGKYKIAARVSRWLRFTPFVRMIAMTGTVAMKNCEKGSDIDFLVVLEKGRIWTGRLLVTLVVQILRRRRYGKKIKDRICLNYFITTGSLEIKKKDLFAANEYSFLYPLYGFRVYKKFGETNHNWIRKYKPNYIFDDIGPFRYAGDTKFSRFTRSSVEGLINFLGGDRMESWLKKKQVDKIRKNPLTYKKEGYVEANDENLVFLPEPQGPGVIEQFEALTPHQFRKCSKDNPRG